MISGVNNIIFASGDRMSERRPPSAMAETGSETPERCASSSRLAGLRVLFEVATAGAGRPLRADIWPEYIPIVVRYARQRLAVPIAVIPSSPKRPA